jgi:hypothetical protein
MATRNLAFAAPAQSEQVRQFGADRICKFLTCNVKLSRYNPEAFCGVHSPAKVELRAWRR